MAPSHIPLSNSKKTRDTNQALVITGKLHASSLGANEFDRGKVNGIQRANRGGKRLQGTPQDRRYHFDDGNPIEESAGGIAVRVLKPTRVDPVPDFALEKPA